MGLFLILPIMSKALGLSDPVIAIIGAISTMFGYLIMAIDWTGPNGGWDAGWVMFVSVVFQWNQVINVSLNSQVTKLFEKSEFGQILSIVTLSQCLAPVIANPLFGVIYKETLDTYEGMYLLIVVALLPFILGSNLYIILDVANREYETIPGSAEEKNNNKNMTE